MPGTVPLSTPVLASSLTPWPESSSQDIATPDRTSEIVTKIPERVHPTEGAAPVTGEIPTSLLDSILKDLEEQTGVNPEKIAVIQAQAMVWNDGSLGCARPGEFYTQALVNGYQVILEVDEKKYDYRAANTGYFFLCENGSSPILTPGTPDS